MRSKENNDEQLNVVVSVDKLFGGRGVACGTICLMGASLSEQAGADYRWLCGGWPRRYRRANDAPGLSDELGQQVYVENRAGANGTIGAAAVAKAAPDGYTLILISAGTAAIAPHMYSTMPYNTLTDLVPVAMVSSTPQVLAVNPSVRAKNVSELVALAKAKPGELSIAAVGIGSLSHLALELLKMETRADLLHVPHNGGAPAVTSALGGQVTGVIADLPVLKPLVESGQLRGLGLAAPKRSPFFPNSRPCRSRVCRMSAPLIGTVSWLQQIRRRLSLPS